ncbi:MAG TPA: hydroxyacid dehydrogenase [Aliiroseovarius sp.]|nr:hydroxyacid dehydrogenase [Aliiroseovarius sp.]
MILITEFMDKAAVETLRAQFEVDYAPELADKQEDIPARMAGVKGLIVGDVTQVTGALLDAAPDLKYIGRLGVELDNIDMSACKAHGVEAFPALGASNQSVVEYVLASAMTLLRGAEQASDRVAAGEWPRRECTGRELAGKKLGLVGFGAIAQDVTRVAQVLGLEICAYDPFLPHGHELWGGVDAVGLGTLLKISDIVSLHVPLTKDTHHLIDAGRFALMKPGAVLINAARGGVVDEAALVAAMQAGKLAGAALDVFENEPLSAADGQKFQGIKNLILTPHIGGVTTDSNRRVSALIAEKMTQHMNSGA